MSEDIIPKSLELLALQRLCKKISDHVAGSAVLDLRVSLLNLIPVPQCLICAFPFST
jgi:hypothetical protein